MSEERRQRKTIVRQERRKQLKSRLKSSIKTFKNRVSDGTSGISELSRVGSEIDRAAKNGLIHKNAAARKKSRLAKLMAKATEASKKA